MFTIILLLQLGCTSTSNYKEANIPDDRQVSSQTPPAISIALQQLGIPYRYGGSHPSSGFDCSGLVYYSYKQAGLKLPRTTASLFNASTLVSFSKAQPGDLLFFDLGHTIPPHVALYLGNNEFIHAPSTGKSVEIQKLHHPYWTKHFVSARRPLRLPSF